MAKGGAYEHVVIRKLTDAFKCLGIQEDDCFRTKNSGATKAQPGDVQLSPRFAKMFKVLVECKHYKTVKYKLGKSVDTQPKSFHLLKWWKQVEREQKQRKDKMGILVFRQNNCPDLIAIRVDHFEVLCGFLPKWQALTWCMFTTWKTRSIVVLKFSEFLPLVISKLCVKNKINLFWDKVDKHGPYPSKEAIAEYPEIEGTHCWEWTASTNNGYGVFELEDVQQKAHRIAWELIHGKIPQARNSKDQICICHKCDNRKCVRNLHHFLGTRGTNNKDCVSKNRNSKGKKHSIACKKNLPNRKGEVHGRTKFTNLDILTMRKLFVKGKTVKELCIIYKSKDSTIRAILTRKNFSHLK